jgi:hypothetical protein
MEINVRTYKMDNDKYGVFVKVKNGQVPVLYTHKVGADTEVEAMRRAISDRVFVGLLE